MKGLTIRQRVASGEIVILSQPKRENKKVVGIGRGLRTWVNASIGISFDICDIEAEVRKAKAAEAGISLWRLCIKGERLRGCMNGYKRKRESVMV